MKCNHDEAEQDVALVDGACPLCQADELTALRERVAKLERIEAIAREILDAVKSGSVARNAKACKHGNFATAPYNHPLWCDECFFELEDALSQ